MKMKCPSCSATLDIPDVLIGKSIDCPACGTTFQSAADSSSPAFSARKTVKVSRSSQPRGFQSSFTDDTLPLASPPRSPSHQACTNKASFAVILPVFIVGFLLSVVFFMADNFLLGYLAASLLSVLWGVWVLACLRTIAINSSQK
jgi:hypothetical protein